MRQQDTVLTLTLTKQTQHEVRLAGVQSPESIETLENAILTASTIEEAVNLMRDENIKIRAYQDDYSGHAFHSEIELETTRTTDTPSLSQLPFDIVETIINYDFTP